MDSTKITKILGGVTITGVLLLSIWIVMLFTHAVSERKNWEPLISQAVMGDKISVPINILQPGSVSIAVYYTPKMSLLDPIKYGNYYFTLERESELIYEESLNLKALDVFWVGGHLPESSVQTYRDGFEVEIKNPGNYLLNIQRMSGECCYVSHVEIYFKKSLVEF